jgi:hypothetical protein
VLGEGGDAGEKGGGPEGGVLVILPKPPGMRDRAQG